MDTLASPRDRRAPATDHPAYAIFEAAEQTVPFVFASPHSGIDYPPEFVAAARLDPLSLRRSEDSFVDELFASVPAHGAPILCAKFPRAYVDPNREPFELDPEMFDDALPGYVNTASPRVAAGLGTIARVVTNGAEIYKGKLRFADALDRVNRLYRPYHDALAGLLERTRARFGHAVLIDCHSMPSIGGPMDKDPGRKRVDFVLGDAHGASCDPRLTDLAEASLAEMGYAVRRNLPYAGGFTTRHYGNPVAGVHALQIEINRAIYMDEDRFERLAGFGTIVRNMGRLVGALTSGAVLERIGA
jgi:N-formylglutamate amidohydrolase